MRQYATRLNRTWLALLGLALLLVALYLLGLAIGVAPGPAQDSSLASPAVGSALSETWSAVAIAGVGVLVALLALAWLAAQVPRTRRARPLRLQDDAARGLTLCSPEVLSDAVEADLTGLAGVHSADAILRGTATAPELTVRLGVDDRADIQSLLGRIDTDVAERLATAMDTPLTRLAIRFDVERAKRDTKSVRV